MPTNPNTMDAGAELRSRVAVEVMGWTPETQRSTIHGWRTPEGKFWTAEAMGFANVFQPDIDIAAAWMVRAEMIRLGYSVSIYEPNQHNGNREECCIENPQNDEARWIACADTAPLAICRAALLTLAAKAVQP